MEQGDGVMTLGYGLGMLMMGIFAIALAGGLFVYFTNKEGDNDSGSK